MHPRRERMGAYVYINDQQRHDYRLATHPRIFRDSPIWKVRDQTAKINAKVRNGIPANPITSMLVG